MNGFRTHYVEVQQVSRNVMGLAPSICEEQFYFILLFKTMNSHHLVIYLVLFGTTTLMWGIIKWSNSLHQRFALKDHVNYRIRWKLGMAQG